MTSVQEFAGTDKITVEGRILRNALLLGERSVNHRRFYSPDIRKAALAKFKNKTIFDGHTLEENGQKYYRRPYTEVLATVGDEVWDSPEGVRANIYLAHHPLCDRVIKNIISGLPIGGFSPEMDVEFDNNAEDGSEVVKEIHRVKCLALTPCAGTTSLIESVVDDQIDALEADTAYHARRSLMAAVEALLLDEEEDADGRFLKIHHLIGEHMKVFKETVEETEKETEKPQETPQETVQETEQETEPVIKTAVPLDFITQRENTQTQTFLEQIWNRK